MFLKKELYFNLLPAGVVWSPFGPVPTVGVAPLRFIQSKISVLSSVHPQGPKSNEQLNCPGAAILNQKIHIPSIPVIMIQ
jgi:hypothetical protein